MRILLTLILLLPLCFTGGWVLGSTDFSKIKKAVADSYINRYNAMTGNNIDEVIYYVVSQNRSMLDQVVQDHSGINKVTSTGYSRMYNVHLDYADKREALQILRQLDGVNAVFTVPFICH